MQQQLKQREQTIQGALLQITPLPKDICHRIATHVTDEEAEEYINYIFEKFNSELITTQHTFIKLTNQFAANILFLRLRDHEEYLQMHRFRLVHFRMTVQSRKDMCELEEYMRWLKGILGYAQRSVLQELLNFR